MSPRVASQPIQIPEIPPFRKQAHSTMHSPVNQSPQNVSSANASPPRIPEIPPFRPRIKSKEWMPNIEVSRLKVSLVPSNRIVLTVWKCTFLSIHFLDHCTISSCAISFPLVVIHSLYFHWNSMLMIWNSRKHTEHHLTIGPSGGAEWAKRLKAADPSIIHRSTDCIVAKVTCKSLAELKSIFDITVLWNSTHLCTGPHTFGPRDDYLIKIYPDDHCTGWLCCITLYSTHQAHIDLIVCI